MNRWHEALERLAEKWERLDARVASDMARRLRSALEIGVYNEREALLVLAALGYETHEGIDSVLGREVRQ